MALSKFGFIVTGGRFVQYQGSGKLDIKVVGVDQKSEALDVAREMLTEGIQLIELCGGFGPVWAGRIIEAIDNAVPVGLVTYGLEAVPLMANLSSD